MKRRLRVLLSVILVICCTISQIEMKNVRADASAQNQKETIYTGDGFSIKYVIETQWNNEYIANIIITNTGDQTIENWELSYKSHDAYSNIWNAEISYHAATIYNIKNAGHNQNIKPGESVSFGFQASFSGKEMDIPKTYKILGDELVVNNKECQVNFDITNQWETGCIMEVSLYNNSDETIEDWFMDFKFDNSIDNIWRAKIENKEGNIYRLKNCEYNSIIKPKQTEKFGMQISFPKGTSLQKPTEVNLYQYRKDSWYLDFDKIWNRTMIKANDEIVLNALQKNKNTIKVGLIDSGVDYSSNINIVDSENFVEDYDDKNPIFQDVSGHGTAVAGVLASDSTQNADTYQFENKYLKQLSSEKIDGVNPYVEIYSAEVLDDNNKTTVDRLVNGINWALEKDVRILNICCGLSHNSEKLYRVIKKAYDKGVLIIAAAGNGDDVQYPAKYKEVMAVGAVKCNGKIAENSATGDEIEVVAPGEDVTTYGPFGILSNFSGTSIAVPQVTALASILWQQDLSKSADFVRQLINSTARSLGDSKKFGNGLIDCSFALKQYNLFNNSYKDSVKENESILLEDNNETLLLTDVNVVRGFWSGENHQKAVKKLSFLKNGAVWPDNDQSKVKGMIDHPEFHGYFDKDYIKSYIIMTEVAEKMYKNGKWLRTKKSDGKFKKNLVSEIKEAAKIGFEEKKCTTKESKGYFIYGMALHTVADIFSHSTAGIKGKQKDRGNLKKKSIKKLRNSWGRLKHGKRKPDGHFDKDKNFADMAECIPRRFEKSAMNVCGAIINQSVNKHKKGTEKVFVNISYYKLLEDAEKYKKKNQKKNFLLNSYGIYKLSEYLDTKNNKKLERVVNNASNAKIKEVINKW